jgi:hypothetical protein
MASKIIADALPETDLDFIVNKVAPEIKNKSAIKLAIRGDPKFRKALLADDRLFESMTKKDASFISASPRLVFEVLLRRSIKEMNQLSYTTEESIPIFDAEKAMDFLENEEIVEYLIMLLSSFIAGNIVSKNDLDLDELIELGKNATADKAFEIYQRIGDVCLFTLGVYPESIKFGRYYFLFNQLPPMTLASIKTVGDYEWLGKEFYHLAAAHKLAQEKKLNDTLELLSENIYLAKKPLNYLSANFLQASPKKTFA